MEKTKAEIRKLKDDWCKDPCWDIEDTDGFEDHYEELAAFNKVMHQKWQDDEDKRQADKLTEAMGIEAIETARLAALNEEWNKARTWAAIAQAEATYRLIQSIENRP